MDTSFAFSKDQFSALFPFYLLVNRDKQIISYGKSVAKLCAFEKEKSFESYFKIPRPFTIVESIDDLIKLQNQMVLLNAIEPLNFKLRGQFEYLPEKDAVLFAGSPWFGSMEEVREKNLVIDDFARHDPLIDMLHIMKSYEITNDDLKELVKTTNRQKNELKIANKEIRDIALFPTQNPDPLIRINFEGKLLRMNPAAEKLGNFEIDGEGYSSEEVFIYIANNVSTATERVFFEVVANGKDYSFVCIPMRDDGYINLYGRDVTQQNIDRRDLERLSLIIQQTHNAVIVTDARGKVEWVNDAFPKITGYSLEEMKGKSPGSVLQGEKTDAEVVQYIRNQISAAKPFVCEIYNYKKSGEGYWLRINSQPIFDKKGQVIQYFAIEEDITREKEALEKIQEFDKRINKALQNVGDNVWEHNFQTEETVFSQDEFKLLGYSPQEFKDNKNLWYTCIHPDDKSIVTENDVKYRTGLIDHHTLEYRLVKKDGGIKWVLDRGVVIEKTNEGMPLKIIGTHTDITRQKEIEKKLEATAGQLSSLIKNLNAGVLLENSDMTIGLVNEQLCEMFGLKHRPDKIKGKDMQIFLQQSGSIFKNPDAIEKDIAALRNNRTLRVGDLLQLKDGRYYERDFIPIRNEEDNDGYLWVYIDVTEKINADQKLDEQRKFYEQILDNIPSDIAVFDDQHRYLYLNPKAISDPELRRWMIGKKDEDYIQRRNKPLSLLEGRRNLFNGIMESKQLKSWEEKLQQEDGSFKYILRNMYPVVNDLNKVEIVIGYGVDISEIKEIQQKVAQSEKKYRDLIQNSLAIITTHDMKGSFTSANPMVKKLYGFEDAELIGHNLTEFMPAEDRKLFDENYLDIIKRDKEASGIFRVLHRNGSIVYSLYNNYLKEEPGEEPYVIGFAVDITERVLMEKELKIAKKITEELAQTKHNFLVNMSHEIRTPMNAIMGMSRQLQKSPLNLQQNRYLDAIRSSSEDLLMIINDILDLAKLEAGKLSIEKIGFDPKVSMARVMQVMQHKAEEKGILFTNSFFDTRIASVLRSDPYRLNQVMLNLVSNAIKFTLVGSVDISCVLVEEKGNEQKVRFIVSDTGTGMDDSFLKSLFKKFSQEDESVGRRFGGTGLGMNITKQLVDLMEGTIEVESRKGVGTSVSVTFFFEKGMPDDLPQKQVTPFDTGNLINKKILVADDNEMNRLVATTILKEYGVLVTECTNGEEAVEATASGIFDLVLMDIQMPVMDGFEATREIRNTLHSNLPVIALTANAIKGENEKCIKAGMNDYLNKPFEERELIELISKWLGSNLPDTDAKPVELSGTGLFDLSKLKGIANGNEAFVKKMIQLFIDQTPPSVAAMEAAYRANDFEAVSKIAHRIKPSIDNMGIISLKSNIREIELQAVEFQQSERLIQLIDHVKRVIGMVVESLKEEMLEK